MTIRKGLFLTLISAGFLNPAWAEIAVHTDFPGGSGVVEKIDEENSLVIINPADHPDRGWRCWWYVKLTGLTPGKQIFLDVGQAPWATPDQASYSIDGGKTWQHSEKGTRQEKRIRYPLSFATETALVAWGPPFVPSDAEALVERVAVGVPGAKVFSLCRTREDRDTPGLRFSPGEKEKRPLIWIQARQHAWESGASWVGKGFVEWLASDKPSAVDLRQRAEIVFIPIMDIDNVFRGAGGKSQKPQDHNRDWSSAPHWNAVASAQKEIGAAAAEGRLAAFVDLHNPGAGNRFPYFYVPPKEILTEKGRANQAAFVTAAKKEITGPLRFTGQTIESGAKYDAKAWKAISKNWVASLGTDAVSVTLETAWNTSASTTKGYEAVGRQLGRALQQYLSEGE